MLLFRRWALNRADLIIGFVAIVVVVAMGAFFWIDSEKYLRESTSFSRNIAAALLSSWVVILLACIGGAIKITSTRQSLIRLFTSEIKALQYGLSNIEMFHFWRLVFENVEKGAMGFADVPRNENYFQNFDTLGQHIGNLHPNAVEAIVRFYTYLRMSRDAAAALQSWEKEPNPAIRKEHVMYVVKLLAQSMLWGFIALWFMGFTANEHEVEFLKKIEVNFDAVFEPGAFQRLRSVHVRSEALKNFFP